MKSKAIVIDEPGIIALRMLEIADPTDDDIVVESAWSGISSGTEKLLFNGEMPHFPGLQYPLVPGYETVGRVTKTGSNSHHDVDDLVFVPGASCYTSAAGLFGASASQLTVPASRAIAIPHQLAESGALLALAATAYHATTLVGSQPPDIVIGHGVLGRLIARIVVALGHPAPQIWELNPARRQGAGEFEVLAGPAEGAGPYNCVLDASGDSSIIDTVLPHLSHGGEIILAGFYGERLSFKFVNAFMREAKLRIAAEFKPTDIQAVLALITDGKLSLDNLITNIVGAEEAQDAYASAFTDPTCLKMAIDWRTLQ